MKSTIDDVARLAGVSITTVSRVLNNNYPVKKETRQVVEAAIKELNYHPNPLARGLISKKSRTIGIVVPSITNMFFTEVISGFEKYAKLMGYDVLLSTSNGDADAEVTCVDKLINRFVDGIIVVDPQMENIESGFYDDIAYKLPLICVNGYNEKAKVNFLITNQEKGTIDALEYLIKLGHRKIAFVRGGKSHSYDIKENIYRDYMNKLNSTPIIIDTLDGNSIEVVNATAKRIIELNDEKYEISKDITAFFACNDLMAVGILNGCSELYINVPDRVSVIGFDNIILSEMTKTKLTTVDQYMRKVGREASENIITLIENNELRTQNIIIQTKLIERESCGTA
jgi:LacI family transcriptional regulator